MFNELRNSIRELLATAEYEYKLADNMNKFLDKVENRYNRYEKALKVIASYYDKDNYSLSLKQDFTREAKEALKTEEEITKEQVDKLIKVFRDLDKEIIIKATEIYLEKLND